MSVLQNLKPKLLWKYFDEIRKIPRASGKEEKIGEYVISVAKKLGLSYQKDKVGNILIRKPGSAGHEKAPVVILQGHLDMVCEKNSNKKFDFDKDPIEVVIDGEWLKADGTTLGADNGVGVAAALAILEDKSLVHGPIEAIFTIDEERGLVGAMNLSKKWLTGRTLINLDSEDLGVFSIGCAGGADSHIHLPVRFQKAKGDTVLEIQISGLRGGHSGIDIQEGRGNALKILNRLLYQMSQIVPFELACLEGGDKHNAIPREAKVRIVLDKQRVNAVKKWISKASKDIQIEFNPVEQNIQISVKAVKGDVPKVMPGTVQNKLMALLFALPHGPLAMSRSIKGLVETSNNVASVKCVNNEIRIHLSSRSSNMAALKATRDKLAAIAGMAPATIDQPDGYPGWMPNLESDVLKVALNTYKQVTGKTAKYEAIHAGLECGLIGEKFPGMDMISIGPTLKHPHSPDERVHIESVNIFYKHILKILEALA
ncbi:MAG TPA: aminoacyl-histidine dipeptidase [bacterium]|nr:aminoacyl-histidine dipeptidase [bacterium]HNT64704.1 aminoacyl-histidine dipeptidase [bacterium]